MKRLTVILLAVLLAAPAVSAQTRKDRLREHVYYFASDSLRGRSAGTADAIKAAFYIREHFAAAGVRPMLPDGWSHAFEHSGTMYRNIVGVIEGRNPELKDEYIVVGAHFDHLGVKDDEVYNGADDNASGSAAVIEIARGLVERNAGLGRSVIVAGFDAEELGLYGSTALAKTLDTLVGRDNIRLMLSIDMVGWYGKSGYLEMEGTSTIRKGRELLQADADKYGLNLKMKNFESSVFTATDTEGFARLGIPTLAVSTGLESPYHKPGDDAELIDYDGLDTVTAYLTDLVYDISRDPGFCSSGRIAAKHKDKPRFLQAGLIAGLGSASMTFPGSAVIGRPAFDWSGGAMAKINLLRRHGVSIAALSVAALYESASTKFPSAESLYSSASVYNQKAITVPVMAMLQAKEYLVGLNIGVGPYYSHPFSSTLAGSALPWSVNPDQWGVQFGFGMDLFHFTAGMDFRWQCNNLFIGNGVPDARIKSFNVHVGYLF